MKKITAKALEKSFSASGVARELIAEPEFRAVFATFASAEFNALAESFEQSRLMQAMGAQINAMMSSLGVSGVEFADDSGPSTSLDSIVATHCQSSHANSSLLGQILAELHEGAEDAANQLCLKAPSTEAERACQALMSFFPEMYHAEIYAARDASLLAKIKPARKPRAKARKTTAL
jgi:hypothetical protein